MSFFGGIISSNPTASAAEGAVEGLFGGVKAIIDTFVVDKTVAAQMAAKVVELKANYQMALLADVNSARQMERDTKSKTPGVLSYFTITAFVACFASLLWVPLNPVQMGVIATLTGLLGSMIKDVYGYWFGTSSSSDSDADTIKQLQAKLIDLHSKTLDQLGAQQGPIDNGVNIPK